MCGRSSANSLQRPDRPEGAKSFEEANELAKQRKAVFALEAFKKADKQDGHHCAACQDQIMGLAAAEHDWKAAHAAADELLALTTTPAQQSQAHLEYARLLMTEAQIKKNPQIYADAQKQLDAVLALEPKHRTARYLEGMCLACQGQDAQASTVFGDLSHELKPNTVEAERIARLAERPELARARMAPAFSVETIDGQHVSLDELHGKVVLIDFWATWCGPCREALPHLRKIADKFKGEPLVVLSISIDTDEAKWRQFVAANGMTWLQARDAGGFPGKLPRLFEVDAIPHTFTIDTDGVLQDEHIGDGDIEGKLKKLLVAARTEENRVAEASAPKP